MYGTGWGMHQGVGMMGTGFFGGGFFGPLLNILILLFIVWVVIRLAQSLFSRRPQPHSDGVHHAETTPARDRDDSLNILKARFARGEIDEDEYRRMKTTLEH